MGGAGCYETTLSIFDLILLSDYFRVLAKRQPHLRRITMSAQPITLVTTATGKTGRQTALSLLSRGLPVRAMVHRSDARAQALRSRGAEIVVGNLADVDDIHRALHGVQRAYWAAPTTPGALEGAAAFAGVAEEEKLEGGV